MTDICRGIEQEIPGLKRYARALTRDATATETGPPRVSWPAITGSPRSGRTCSPSSVGRRRPGPISHTVEQELPQLVGEK